jgi:hypothetical protein
MTDDKLQLTPEDLLAGAELTHEVAIHDHVLRSGAASRADAGPARVVQLRPLTLGTFQLIMRAARSDASLIPLLMIKESLVEPAMSLDQIKRLSLGLITFLIGHIREISGLQEKKSPQRS